MLNSLGNAVAKYLWQCGLAALALSVLLTGPSVAQEGQSLSNKTANPLGGDFMMVIQQYDRIRQQGRLVDGPAPDGTPGPNPAAPREPTVNVFTMQPVISAPMDKVIGPNWGFVMRPTFQVFADTDLPDFTAFSQGPNPLPFPPPNTGSGLPFSSVDGFGDVSAFALLGKTFQNVDGAGGQFVLAPGLAWSLPWGDDDFTDDQYSIGPALAAVYLGKRFVVGGLAQQFYDVHAKERGAEDVNKMLLQIPYYLNINQQWAVGASPLWVLDFENDSYEMPIGLGAVYTGPVFGSNLPPWKIGFEFSTYADQNDFYGGDFAFKIYANPILPSPIKKLFPRLF